MDRSYRDILGTWHGATTIVHPTPRAETLATHSGPHDPEEFAERLYTHEALRPKCLGSNVVDAAEPYTLQWFLEIESHRHGRSGHWIPKLMEFARHHGELLLGLGNGLGTDWLQYARNGANVVVCSPSKEHLALTRRNFELRNLAGRFLHAIPTCLPLDDETVDVACISNLFQEGGQPEDVIREVYRVLKPGGKVLAMAAARFDVDYWCRFRPFWQKNQARTSASMEISNKFTARLLRQQFGEFIEHRIHKRQLRRNEVPHPLRWLPMSFLERTLGRILIIKAFKPLSAAHRIAIAA